MAWLLIASWDADFKITESNYFSTQEEAENIRQNLSTQYDNHSAFIVQAQYSSEEIAFLTVDIENKSVIYHFDQHQAHLENIEWMLIRKKRDQKMKEFEWRLTRHASETRLGLTPQDDIALLDTYMQALRDLTTQEDPFAIIWPEVPA